MDNNCSPENALLPDQLNQAVLDAALPVAVAVGLEVAEVADMADFVARRAVRLAKGVEVWPGRGAAVRVVAFRVLVSAGEQILVWREVGPYRIDGRVCPARRRGHIL